MRGCVPTLGYPSRGEAVLALAHQGLTVPEIAERTGQTRRAVQCIMRYTRRKRGLGGPYRFALIHEAHKRGLSVQELELRLLESVAKHNLVDAILDDRQEAAE